MSGIIVTINLQGSLEGSIKHKDIQTNTIQINKKVISKDILHSDRKTRECYKVLHISEETVAEWESNNVPSWESDRAWKKKSPNRKILSYLEGLDEGFGLTYELIS